MPQKHLDKEITLKTTAAHLLVLWDILSNRPSGEQFKNNLTDTEKKAVWALEDLLEKMLSENGFNSIPENEWHQLLEKAAEHIETMTVEFLD